MMSVMSFMLPATPVYQSVESVSRAATVKSDATYISETKLFIKKGGSAGDAKAWCESQGAGWQVLDGDLKVPMAVNAHDFLNAYIDDDSNELLGDLLLTVEDDKLAEILLQTNGVVLLTIQQMLASACDTGKNTWIDRMVRKK